MTGDDLTREQTEKIIATLTPTLAYLGRLTARMKQEFVADDPLLKRARAAKGELQALTMTLHYIGCSGGVGRPRKTGDTVG